MKDDDEVVRFLIAATLGAALMKVKPSSYPRTYEVRRDQPGGYSLPGGKGHSFGQRMGKRRTQS